MSDNKRKNMSEIFDPVKDFFIIRKGKEKLLFYGIPVLVGIISIVLFIFVHGNNDFNLPNFTNEFVKGRNAYESGEYEPHGRRHFHKP